jgi:ubiquinone/menaquinone biosynthesis C-methylase UbiE
VLEVGFGHGRTIAAIACRVPNGFVAGVDLSAAMLRLASRSNLTAIQQSLLELKLGDSSSLPYSDRRFDKALAVHTIYFWKDPVAHFRELVRVLRRAGMLVLGFRPDKPSTIADFPPEVYQFRSVDETCQLLSEAGFSQAEVAEYWRGGHRLVFVTARLPAC